VVRFALDSAREISRTTAVHGRQVLDGIWALLDLIRPPRSRQQDAEISRLRGILQLRYQGLAETDALIAEQQGERRRHDYARELERRMLGQGSDVYVSLTGRNGTTMRMRWILVSRPLAYQIGEDGTILQRLRELGFRRFEITDGYDQTWYWNLR
jgi:hypothetical protein